ADDGGDPAERQKTKRSKSLDRPARQKEQRDLDATAGHPESAHFDTVEAQRAPMNAAEAVEDSVAGLDQRSDQDKDEEARLAQDAPGWTALGPCGVIELAQLRWRDG